MHRPLLEVPRRGRRPEVFATQTAADWIGSNSDAPELIGMRPARSP